MKVWVSKYALTTGIFEVENCEITSSGKGVMWKDDGCFWQSVYGLGREYHTSQEDAFIRAEAMRLDRIASLRKQIAKLEKLKFHA